MADHPGSPAVPTPAPTPAVPTLAPTPATPGGPPPPVLTNPAPNSLVAHWWPGPGRIAAPGVLIGIAASGIAAALLLPWDTPGVGWLATAAVAATATGVAARTRRAEPAPRRWDRLAWTVLALALIAVGTVRAAGWLFVLCLLAACLAGSLAVAGGRSAISLLVATVMVPVAAARALPWAARGVTATRSRSAGRTAVAAVIAAGLLVVFGALFASADAVFASVLDDVLPNVDGATVFRWIFLFLLVGLGTLGACYLVIASPTLDGDKDRQALRRIEWALPLGFLVVLFGAFVAVQAAVLFGGGGYVERTAGLTYAEYARRGFWQLLVATLLTLGVIALAARVAARKTVADRAWLRALLGALAALTLVIVASAMSRMWAYEQAYGFTRLRLLVSACEVWLGAIFVLVLGAGIRLRARWLPRLVLGTGLVTLLGLAALNPDRFIAERNLARPGPIDLGYLSDLSADAVPALSRLPEPARTCLLQHYQDDLQVAGSSWVRWNLGRWQAGRVLRADPPVGADELHRAGACSI